MAEPTPEELHLLASELFCDWEERLPSTYPGDELPIEVQPGEVVNLVQRALVRGIEIGRQHAATTTEEKRA